MGESITIHTPAKVNLALSVGAPDTSGYHPLASWMIAVDLCDTLRLAPTSGPPAFDIAVADDPPATSSGNRPPWTVEDDLSVRAHRLMEWWLARSLPIKAELRKRIPPAMGLGGGSSDAAAMLVGLDRLFRLSLGADRLTALGRELGSDVPFIVKALIEHEPTAVVTGTGEHWEAAPLNAPLHLTLVLPPLSCATGRVYEAFDTLHPGAGPADATRVRSLAQSAEMQGARLFNELRPAAERVEPELVKTIERVSRRVELPVHLTGSGAGLFVVAASADHAASMAEQIRADAGWTAVAVRPWSATV